MSDKPSGEITFGDLTSSQCSEFSQGKALVQSQALKKRPLLASRVETVIQEEATEGNTSLEYSDYSLAQSHGV